ncbi:MAG: hypothetical protein ABJ327_23520 [Litoreibacter sp.]
MSRLLKRWISAACILCAQAAMADIPMVATAIVVANASELPRLPDITPQKFNQVKLAARHDETTTPNLRSQSDISPFGMPCVVELGSTTAVKAMIKVEVYAPCSPYAEVRVAHEGLEVTGQISLIGTSELILPAMAKHAQLRIEYDGKQTLLEHETPDFEKFARVVLSSNEVDPTRLASPNLEVFRSQGMQVLTVDLDNQGALKVHRLTLLRAVTEQNCGRPQQAELLQVMPGKIVQTQTLRFAAISCARIGDTLKLKNVVEDLKLASN